jgi:hypothetical protein
MKTRKLLAIAMLAAGFGAAVHAQTPLYQWSFNGVSGTGVPSITAGGGTLSTLGSGSFTGAGPSGAATDFAYNGTGTSDGATSAADISGLGTLNQMTVTFWIRSSVAYTSQGNSSARLLMLGNSTSYDESNPGSAPGFSLALAGSTGLQYNINKGVQPSQGSVFTPYAANQWVFVVVEYDGTAGGAYYSGAMGTALGNSSRNMAIMTGTDAASIGAPTMVPMTISDYSTSPGPITNTATMCLLVGNRNNGSVNRGFMGRIDDIRIYNSLLTSNQLETVRTSDLPTVLTVGTPTASVANPVRQGTTDTLSATVIGGTAPYTYQWLTDGGSGGSLTNIPGATNATYNANTTGVTFGANYSYSLMVTDSVLATATSSVPAVVNVYQLVWQTATNSTTTNTLGFSFVNNSGSGLTSTTNTAFLFSTNSAGAPGYAQTNWNNCAQTGDNYSGGFAVSNSLGSATPLIVSWAGNGVASTGTATNLNTSDGKLMDGYLAMGYANQTTGTVGTNVANSPATTKPLVYVGGLKAWYLAQGAEGFGLVVYQTAGSSYDTTFDWVQSVTGSPTNGSMSAGADLTPRLYNVHSSQFSGTYTKIPGTATNQANKYYGANYCVFQGLTNDAVLVRSGDTNEPWGSASMNGFQIVPVYATAPTATAPTFSPASPVYSGVPVTVAEAATGDAINTALYYQWLTDGGSGGSLTNMPNATNATVTLTPASSGSSYTMQFQVIVTNFMGSVTSSVSVLTVNPGAPVVNNNTSPSNSVYAFANGSVTFTANFNGSLPMTNQWATSSSYPLTGATNNTLVLTNLQTTADGTYQLLVTNAQGNNTSSAATLTVLTDPAAPDVSTPYPYDVFTNGPVAYWRFNETTLDVSANSVQAYDYSGHNLNATYGSGTYPVDDGLDSPSFPGFESVNQSVELENGLTGSYLTVPPLNLNTNTVTISMWINPNTVVGTYWGLLMWANTTNGDKAGFGFGSTQSNSVAELGYTWNTNSPSTYGFHSGLYPPTGQWSFVSLVITPTNSTIYLYYTDGSGTHLSKAVQTIANSPEAFGGSGGTVWIGMDAYTGRTFDGFIDEVSVFNKSLSEAQIQGLYSAGSGVVGVAPYITSDTSATPANFSSYFPGQVPAVTLTANGDGMPVPAYMWQAGAGGVFTNLVDGGSFAGSGSGTLTINPVTPATYLDYRLLLTNVSGSATSSVYTVSQPIVPNGLWTARFQITPTEWGQTGNSGSFTGLGVLGSGTYWNSVPAYGWGQSAAWSSATSYQDNGSTNSGITCTLTGGSNVSSGPYATNDVRGLLSQVVGVFGTGYTTNSIALANMPNGYYNLAIHGACAGWNDRGATFRVHGMNGDQIAGTTNTPQVALYQDYVTTVLFTNVEVTNGILNVDVEPTPIVPSHNPNTEGYYNAVEVQLASYGLPTVAFSGTPVTGAAPLAVVFTNTTIGSVTNSAWNFGDGNTVAVPSTANVTNTYATAGTYTVSLVVAGLGGVGTLTNTAYIVVTNAVVISSDASLSYLALSPLGALTPNFNTTLTNYMATNAIGTTSVTVTVTNTSALATNALFLNGVLQGSPAAGSLAGTVAVAVGSGNVIQVVVTAQDGVTTSTNTVTVTVLPSTNAYLTSLVLNPAGQAGLTTSFVSTTESYLATNAYGYTPTFTVVNADLTATNSLIYNNITNGLASGVASTTPTLNLTLGVTNVAQVQVTAQDGVTVQTYVVNIVEQPSQTVPHLTNSVSGNNLVLSWPGDHLGYRLLVQTNNLNKGVSGNIGDWGTVPGSTNLTGTSITILKTGVTNMYYKLVYP